MLRRLSPRRRHHLTVPSEDAVEQSPRLVLGLWRNLISEHMAAVMRPPARRALSRKEREYKPHKWSWEKMKNRWSIRPANPSRHPPPEVQRRLERTGKAAAALPESVERTISSIRRRPTF